MVVEQIYTGCLAQGAYYIYSNGEAAIIDPLREVKPYIDRAKKDGVNIKYVFETHFHADFVSGHLTLAEKTGATIVYGPLAAPAFDAHIAEDEEIFTLGKVKIKVLHTPGHTMESSTFLLIDESGKEHSIFTGDTLFLRDVGRPDLAQKANEITMDDLAGHLFDSLRNKIMPLADDVIVYPAHGAGSACGKNMMKETVDTLGNQKRMNYALRADMTKDEFIKEVTYGLLPPPGYFPLNVKMNKEGYESIDQVLASGLRELSAREFELLAKDTDAIILDVRSAEEYAAEHIPNSIFIGLDGNFAPWAGDLIVDVQQKIILIAPEGREEETVTRLSRVGFDKTLGYLKGGIVQWKAIGLETDIVQSVTANKLHKVYDEVKDQIFDMRKESEFISQHVLDAINTPLSAINTHLSKYPSDKDFYVYCAGGYRFMITASILKSRGYHNVIDVEEGFKSIEESSLPVSEYICPSTL